MKGYEEFNAFIDKIRMERDRKQEFHRDCRRMLDTVLSSCNQFEKDRFDYPVNNAYLLKNANYCRYYFLLKKVFMKQKSIEAFLDIMKALPQRAGEGEAYLKKFI